MSLLFTKMANPSKQILKVFFADVSASSSASTGQATESTRRRYMKYTISSALFEVRADLISPCPEYWNQRDLDEDYVGLLTKTIEEEGMSPFHAPVSLMMDHEWVSCKFFCIVS